MYKGTDKISQIYKGTKPVRRIYKGDTLVYKIAPSGYVGTEYLESDGNQYIDTNITPNINSGIYIEYSYTTLNTPAGICGNYTPSGLYPDGRRDALFISTQSGSVNSTEIMLFSRGIEYHTNTLVSLNTKYKASINYLGDNKIKFDNLETANGTNLIDNTIIRLFSRFNASANNFNYSSAKIYSCKISNGTTLVRNFIPSVRLSDGEAGLYDLVNDVFYTNQGTGKFKYGKFKNIPDGYAQVDLGTLEWTYNGTRFATDITDITLRSTRLKGLCSKYPTFNGAVADAPDKSIIFSNSSYSVYVKDSSYTDATSFTTAMSDVWLLYQKA